MGTGGDNAGSWNVSTLACILAAACGAPVAKHGNRAASSKSGASDVLTALGVTIGLQPPAIEACIREANIGFMMAPTHHAAMRTGPVRVELGTRTIFNILGPLSNPAFREAAGRGRVLAPSAAPDGARPCATWARRPLGRARLDGLDEITTTGPTKVVALANGDISEFDVTPEDAGIARARPEDLRGGDPAHNAQELRNVLDGSPAPTATSR